MHLDQASFLHLQLFAHGILSSTAPETTCNIFDPRTFLDHTLASLASLLDLLQNGTNGKKSQQNGKKQRSYLTKFTSSSLL